MSDYLHRVAAAGARSYTAAKPAVTGPPMLPGLYLPARGEAEGGGDSDESAYTDVPEGLGSRHMPPPPSAPDASDPDACLIGAEQPSADPAVIPPKDFAPPPAAVFTPVSAQLMPPERVVPPERDDDASVAEPHIARAPGAAVVPPMVVPPITERVVRVTVPAAHILVRGRNSEVPKDDVAPALTARGLLAPAMPDEAPLTPSHIDPTETEKPPVLGAIPLPLVSLYREQTPQHPPTTPRARHSHITIGRLDVQVNNHPARSAAGPPARTTTPYPSPDALETHYLDRIRLL